MHTPKKKKKKKKRRSTYQTWCLRLLVLFLSTVVMGDGQEIWHLLLRTASRRRPSRLGQYWQKTFVDVFNTLLQHFTTKMPFLTTSRITFSCLASVAPQADSWWLGHLVTDDVVIADIGGQALDILLHGPESAHKNGIVKTFIHTSIPIHTPCTLLKKKKKNKKRRSTYQTWCLRLLVLFLSTVVMGDGQEAWHLLLRTASRRWPSRLEQYWQKTFVDGFKKYSNISRQKCPS